MEDVYNSGSDSRYSGSTPAAASISQYRIT